MVRTGMYRHTLNMLTRVEIKEDNMIALKPVKKDRKTKKKVKMEKTYFDVMEEHRQSAQKDVSEGNSGSNSGAPEAYKIGMPSVSKIPEAISSYIWSESETATVVEPPSPKPHDTRRAYYRYHRAYTSRAAFKATNQKGSANKGKGQVAAPEGDEKWPKLEEMNAQHGPWSPHAIYVGRRVMMPRCVECAEQDPTWIEAYERSVVDAANTTYYGVPAWQIAIGAKVAKGALLVAMVL